MSISDYVCRQRRLLQLELQEDEESHAAVTEGTNSDDGPSSRVLRGLHIDHASVGLMGRTVVHLSREKFEVGSDGNENIALLPAHRLTVGDEVEILSDSGIFTGRKKNIGGATSGSKKKLTGGVICGITESVLSVALFARGDVAGDDGEDGGLLLGKPPPFAVVTRSSAEVHRRLVGALDELEGHAEEDGAAGSVLRAVFGLGPPAAAVPSPTSLGGPDFVPYNTMLDESQLEAVRFALDERQPISLIHGPPGTGKTTTIAELVHQAVYSYGWKVLVTAPSNVAVDNILERIVRPHEPKSRAKRKSKRRQEGGVSCRAVRLGHPARIQERIIGHSLEALVQSADGTEIVANIREELRSYLRVASDPKRRGADKRAAYLEMKKLRKEIRQREGRVVEGLLADAQVVLSTNVGAASSVLDRYAKSKTGKPFDLVVIDEAAQALEVSCWIPILRGRRVVLAGDHRQLPPTIKSRNREVQRELGRTLFERMMYHPASADHSRMLEMQYRMHEDIADWASAAMYGKKLKSHSSVKSRKLHHLPHVSADEAEDSTSLLSVARSSTLLLVDTAGCDMFEEVNSAGSRYNEGEASVVAGHVRNLINIGLRQDEIAVITPYNGQVELLRGELLCDFPKLEIRSVDGFQGGEREAVVLSLVRSSDRGISGIGFLKDERRLNVAVTRAKRHCAVICDCSTVSQNGFLKGLVTWIEEKGDYLSAMEFMNEVGSNFSSSLSTSMRNLTIEASSTELAGIENTSFCSKPISLTGESEESVLAARNKVHKKEFFIDQGAKTSKDTDLLISQADIAQLEEQNNSGREEVIERVTFFAEVSEIGEEIHFDSNIGNQSLLHELCIQYDLSHRTKDGKIIIYKPASEIAQNSRTSEDTQKPVEPPERSSPRLNSTTPIENAPAPISRNNKFAKSSTPAKSIADPAPVSDVVDSLKCNVNMTPIDKPYNINQLLGSLAKDRTSRAAVVPVVSVIKPKLKPASKPRKGKGKGKAGTLKAKKSTEKAEDFNDLDDMAFLDAQIEKVQTSHGRKVEGTGSNYRSLMNGILIARPEPPEKKKDLGASGALNAKIKQAKQNRKPKKKKK